MMQNLVIEKFNGTNLVSNPNGNISPYSLNVDTENGAVKKAGGLTSLFASLGASAPHGIHSALLTNETLMFGHGTSLYTMSGTQCTITKTLTADFTGTFDGTVASNNSVILSGVGLTSGSINQGNSNDEATYHGQTFVPSANVRRISTVRCYFHHRTDNNYDASVSLYDGVGGTLLGTSNTQRVTGNGYKTLTFSPQVTVIPGRTYYLYVSHGRYLNISTSNPYQYGCAYNSDGVAVTGADLEFYINSGNEYIYDNYAGTYISNTIDLGQTPVASSIAYTKTVTADHTDVTLYVRGSSDGIIWGQWEQKASGSGVVLFRYVQVMAVFSGDPAYITPSLDSFAITYTTRFDTTTAIDTGLSGQQLRFADYGRRVFYCDAGRPRVYNEISARQVGVAAPATVCTASDSGSAGNLNGTYYYKITYINTDGVESNPSLASNSLAVTSHSVALTGIPTLTGHYRKIYRFKQEESGAYYYVATISNDSATTYADNITDATIQVSSRLMKTDNDVPPDSTIVYSYKNYMFYVSSLYPDRLYFSKVYGTDAANPLGALEQVPPTNYKKLPSIIRGLCAYNDKLVVSGDGYTGYFVGDTFGGASDDTAWYQCDDMGCVRHEAMAVCQTMEGTILALGTAVGIRYLTPTLSENSLDRIPLSHDVIPWFVSANTANMWLTFYNMRLFVGFEYVTGSWINQNNSVVVYDFKRSVWDGLWSQSISDCTVYKGYIYGNASNIGKVYQMLSGMTYDGADIHMVHDLLVDMGAYKATIQRAEVHASTDSDTDSLTVEVEVDGRSRIIQTGPKDTWRRSNIYTSQNGMYKIMSVKGRGKFIGIRIEDNSANPIEIQSIILEYDGVKE